MEPSACTGGRMHLGFGLQGRWQQWQRRAVCALVPFVGTWCVHGEQGQRGQRGGGCATQAPRACLGCSCACPALVYTHTPPRPRNHSPDTCVHITKPLPCAGEAPELFYRHLYRPLQGMFCALPSDLALGSYLPDVDGVVALAALPNGAGFIKKGVEYKVWTGHRGS